MENHSEEHKKGSFGGDLVMLNSQRRYSSLKEPFNLVVSYFGYKKLHAVISECSEECLNLCLSRH